VLLDYSRPDADGLAFLATPIYNKRLLLAQVCAHPIEYFGSSQQ
jgi:hypothetical protein